MPQDITWRRIASIWWLLLWRSLLGGVALGFVAGFLIGIAGALLGWGENSRTIAALTGAALGALWCFFVIKMAITKKYRDFRLVLVTDASLVQR